ncbi:hypothetical protein DASC09_001030 [Saccharomycopsis crataegensis]|uniref:Uncharacterized protein n=1 Tax=Saccharomycopsis crataegensis TaxID=43959 RepID=A0AAV5QDC1_9ASCO|nr:hypothetical protein DASC09_001030 [Saccharomycopsis crataegensis]
MVSWNFKKNKHSKSNHPVSSKSTTMMTTLTSGDPGTTATNHPKELLKHTTKSTGALSSMASNNDDAGSDPLSPQELSTLQGSTASMFNRSNVNSYYKFSGTIPLENSNANNDFTRTQDRIPPSKVMHPNNTSATDTAIITTNEDSEKVSSTPSTLKQTGLSSNKNLSRSGSGNEINKKLPKKQSNRNLQKDGDISKKKPRRKSLFGLFARSSSGDSLENPLPNQKDMMTSLGNTKIEDNDKSTIKPKIDSLDNIVAAPKKIQNDDDSDDLISPASERFPRKSPEPDDEEINSSKLIIIKSNDSDNNEINEQQSSKQDHKAIDATADLSNPFFMKHLAKKYSNVNPILPSSPVLSDVSSGIPVTSNPDKNFEFGTNIDTQLSGASSPNMVRRNSLIFERNVQEQPSFSRRSSFLHNPNSSPHQLISKKSASSLHLRGSSPGSPSSPNFSHFFEKPTKPNDDDLTRRRSSSSTASLTCPPGLKSIPNHYILDDYISPVLDSAVNLNLETTNTSISDPLSGTGGGDISPSSSSGINLILEKSPRRPSIIETSLNNYLDKTLNSNSNTSGDAATATMTKKLASSSSTSLLLRSNDDAGPGVPPPESDLTTSPAYKSKSNETSEGSCYSRRNSLYVGLSPYPPRKKSVSSATLGHHCHLNKSVTELNNGSTPVRVKSNTVSSNTSTIRDRETEPQSGLRVHTFGNGAPVAKAIDFNSYAELLDMENSVGDGFYTYSMDNDKNTAVDDASPRNEEFYDALTSPAKTQSFDIKKIET